jgi:hypothetical protein
LGGKNGKHARVLCFVEGLNGNHAHVADFFAVLNGNHAHVKDFWGGKKWPNEFSRPAISIL